MGKNALLQLKKIQIVRNLTKHLGKDVDYGMNFNMPISGCTISSLQIRRSAGNNLHFYLF